MVLRNPFAPLGIDDPPEPVVLSKIPAYALWATRGFIKSWFHTRQLSRLLQGLPAVVLGILLTGLLVSGDQAVSPDTIASYLSRAQQAANLEDYERAEFYFRKLEQVAPQDREVVYEHALLHAKQDNYREAFRLMESLVRDDDRSNDIDVRLWLAKTVLSKDLGIEAPLEYAKAHLVAVLDDNPKELYAQYFFARLYLRQGDIPSAIEHLEHVASYSSELQLLLSSLYLRTDPPDVERARSHASTAVDAFKSIIQETQAADVNTYHQLAAGYVILERYEDAVRTLRQAITRFDADTTRRQLAKAYVAWSDQLVREQPDQVGRRMQLLEQGLEAAPNEPLILNRMLEIAAADGAGAAEAEQRLRQALVDGIAPAIVHFCLGSLAAKRGDSEAAMRHFKQSGQLNPRTAVTLNNMAYLMAQSPDADLNQALELVNQALEMAPLAAPFRDTRGQILVRLGRWSEAVADLEFANSRMEDIPSRIAINRALAEAYAQLGDAETSRMYAEKVRELAGADETKNEADLDVTFDKSADTPASPEQNIP